MRRLIHTADRICSLANSAPYHLVEKPAHTETSREALKEYTINTTIGRYRNSMPSTSMVLEKPGALSLTILFHLPCLETVEQHNRHQQQCQHHNRQGRGHRPVAVVEELLPQHLADHQGIRPAQQFRNHELAQDRKSTRLNSSHVRSS